MVETNLQLVQGDTFRRTITYKSTSAPIDLTGSAIQFEIVPISSSPKITYTLSNYISLYSPTEGVFKIDIPSSITQTYRWRKANYEITVIFADTSTKRILKGTIVVDRNL